MAAAARSSHPPFRRQPHPPFCRRPPPALEHRFSDLLTSRPMPPPSAAPPATRTERRPPPASLPVDLQQPLLAWLPLHGRPPSDPRQGACHHWSTLSVDQNLMQGRRACAGVTALAATKTACLLVMRNNICLCAWI